MGTVAIFVWWAHFSHPPAIGQRCTALWIGAIQVRELKVYKIWGAFIVKRNTKLCTKVTIWGEKKTPNKLPLFKIWKSWQMPQVSQNSEKWHVLLTTWMKTSLIIFFIFFLFCFLLLLPAYVLSISSFNSLVTSFPSLSSSMSDGNVFLSIDNVAHFLSALQPFLVKSGGSRVAVKCRTTIINLFFT